MIDLHALLAVARLRSKANCLRIRTEIHSATGRRYSMGGLYPALVTLRKRKMLKAARVGPFLKPGGRSFEIYTMTAAGRTAMLNEVRSIARMRRRAG